MIDTTIPVMNVSPQELTEKFHEILNAMIEGVQIISPDHRYLYVNDAAVIQNKQTREELIGQTQMERYPGIENTEVFKQMHKCAVERVPTYIENEFQFPDGSNGWYEVRSEPIIYGVMILSLDITERKRVEATVLKEKTQIALISEGALLAEKFNKLSAGRELEMTQLKERIAQLESELKNLQEKTPSPTP